MSDQPNPRDVIRMVHEATSSAGRAASAIAGAVLAARDVAPDIATRLSEALVQSGYKDAPPLSADPAHIEALRVRLAREPDPAASAPAL